MWKQTEAWNGKRLCAAVHSWPILDNFDQMKDAQIDPHGHSNRRAAEMPLQIVAFQFLGQVAKAVAKWRRVRQLIQKDDACNVWIEIGGYMFEDVTSMCKNI